MYVYRDEQLWMVGMKNVLTLGFVQVGFELELIAMQRVALTISSYFPATQIALTYLNTLLVFKWSQDKMQIQQF